MRLAGLFGLYLTLTGTVPAAAASRVVIPPTLQRSAVACLGEALRLCPNAPGARDYGISCILPKRRLLSRRCRDVYDQGLSLLKGRDLHLDLRALRARRPRAAVPAAAPPLAPAAPAPGTPEKKPPGG